MGAAGLKIVYLKTDCFMLYNVVTSTSRYNFKIMFNRLPYSYLFDPPLPME